MDRQVISTHRTSDGIIAYVRQDGQVRIYRLDSHGGKRVK